MFTYDNNFHAVWLGVQIHGGGLKSASAYGPGDLNPLGHQSYMCLNRKFSLHTHSMHKLPVQKGSAQTISTNVVHAC